MRDADPPDVEFAGGPGGPGGSPGAEELPEPSSHPRARRIAAVVLAALVLAGIVVGVTDRRGDDSALPADTTTPSGSTVNPVIPSFALDRVDRLTSGSSTVLSIGRPQVTATIYGGLPLIVSNTCLGDGGAGAGCHFVPSVPAAASTAVRALFPRARPVGQTLSRGSGQRARIELRLLLSHVGPETILVRVVRTPADQPAGLSRQVARSRSLGGRRVLYASHVRGRLTVQVIVQTLTGPHPAPAQVAALARAPGLTALT